MVRRRRFIKTTGIVAGGLVGFTGSVGAEGTEVSSATPPKDYTAVESNVKPHTNGVTTSAPEADAQVLIIKDREPWGYPINEEILQSIGESYIVINSGDLATHDLSPYKLVIVPGDQYTETYSNLAASRDKLRNFVDSGILLGSATTMGHGAGEWSPYLPGNIEYVKDFYGDLTVVDDNITPFEGIDDTDVDGWNSSAHGHFPTIPDNANVAAKVAGGDPVYLSYQLGGGGVVAHTMTFEWAIGEYGIQPAMQILKGTIEALLEAKVGEGISAQNGLAVDGSNNIIYTIDDGDILIYDWDTKEIIGGYPAPNGTNHGLAFGDGSLWYADAATDSYDGAVLELAPETGEVRSKITSGWDPVGLAYGNGSLWVADITAVPNSVHEFSPDGNEVQEIYLDEPGASGRPDGLAHYQDSLWYGNEDGLYRYNLNGGLEEIVDERDPGYKALAGSKTALYGPGPDGTLTMLRGGNQDGPAPLPGFNNPPTDPDGDGLYEDLNGDGTFDISDIQAFFDNYNSPEVQEYAKYYDFNGDGQVDVIDAQALFNKLLG